MIVLLNFMWIMNETYSGSTALTDALKRYDSKVVEYLLFNGADPNGVANDDEDEDEDDMST